MSDVLHVHLGMNPLVSLVVSVPVVFAGGVAIHALLYRRLLRQERTREELEANSLLISFGLLFILQNGALLVFSGAFVLTSAVGFLRFKDFFVRMHPPTLAYTLGNWFVAAAGVLHFSALDGRLAMHPLLVAVLLAVTVPATTVLLARAVLFRRRTADDPDTPPALTPPHAS